MLIIGATSTFDTRRRQYTYANRPRVWREYPFDVSAIFDMERFLALAIADDARFTPHSATTPPRGYHECFLFDVGDDEVVETVDTLIAIAT